MGSTHGQSSLALICASMSWAALPTSDDEDSSIASKSGGIQNKGTMFINISLYPKLATDSTNPRARGVCVRGLKPKVMRALRLACAYDVYDLHGRPPAWHPASADPGLSGASALVAAQPGT